MRRRVRAHYRRLAEDAMDYGKGKISLWRDPKLQITLNWRERIQPKAPWAQRYHPAFEQAMRFLDESREAREGEVLAREAEARAKEQQRRRELTRTRIFASIVAIAFIISSVLAGYAYWWANEAEEQEMRRKNRRKPHVNLTMWPISTWPKMRSQRATSKWRGSTQCVSAHLYYTHSG